MIPAGFEYHRPADVASAVGLIQEHGDDARVIAGGHSLIPIMKLRMADIAHLIDLQDIATLKGVDVGDSHVTFGAMTTQHELIANEQLSAKLPILREAALRHIQVVGFKGVEDQLHMARTTQHHRRSLFNKTSVGLGKRIQP